MTLQSWGVYAQSVPVLENRRQSLAFLYGIGLKPQPLKFPTNHIDKTEAKLDEWLFIETQRNYGVPLVGDFLDIDVDVRPLGDSNAPTSYTTAYYEAALEIHQLVHAALEHAGVRFRAFGRTSVGKTGHFIVELPVPKGEEGMLAHLQMSKYVETRGVKVKIECRRRASPKETSKNFTAAGSVYMRRDAQGFDLIQWHSLSQWADGEVMPRLEPQPYDKVRLGMYMALMGLALLPDWEDAKHDCALEMAGCLAHEWRQGTFSEDDCKAIMQFMIDQAGDGDPKDRKGCLTSALAGLAAHKNITGYPTLAKRVGEDWRHALLKLRGGGDPNTLDALHRAVGKMLFGLTKANVYVDLTAGAERYVEMDATGLAMRFSNNPLYPDFTDRKGKKVPAIRIVMNSPHILTFDQAVTFPGVPFASQFMKDDNGIYRDIDPENPPPLGVSRYVNVAAGFATEPYTKGTQPSMMVSREAIRLYHRLRQHLVADEREAAMLDQIIAHKLQAPREKYPVGLAMGGGHLIGKSFLFDIMLKALLGDTLVKKSNTKDLKSDYSFNGIDRCLFYVFEECELSKLPRETLQIIKDVMRNPTILVNTKWGRIAEVLNRAVPICLANELRPQLIVDGVPDRALCVVHGERQENLEMTNIEWKAHQELINRECRHEFYPALQRVEIRRALLHYFLKSVAWNTELITMHNESRTGAVDVEGGLRPALQALVAMLREGYAMPLQQGDRGPMIHEAQMLETIGAGMRARLKDQRKSFDQGETDNQGVGRALAELFMEPDGRRDGVRRSAGVARTKREKVLKMARYYMNKKDVPMYYFAYRRGELLAMLEERRGIKIVPDYELAADGERGEAPEPSREDMARAYNFATKHAASSSFSMLMGGLT